MLSRAPSDLGCLFLAHRGYGAYSAPLADESAPLTRVWVKDVTNFSEAKLMESFESRHSSHSFTAAVVRAAYCVGVTVATKS